jgi:hypothetical protein
VPEGHGADQLGQSQGQIVIGVTLAVAVTFLVAVPLAAETFAEAVVVCPAASASGRGRKL